MRAGFFEDQLRNLSFHTVSEGAEYYSKQVFVLLGGTHTVPFFTFGIWSNSVDKAGA